MISGRDLRDAMISAANNITNQKQQVDAMNVFPVPDGDTGTNMSMTINAAKRELEGLADDATVAEVSKTASSALLRGARGNSGVITSLLFRGFSKGLKGKETAEADDLINALSIGVESAYKAVMKPTEGTMLTVARVSAETIKAGYTEDTTVAAMWDQLVAAARDALAKTPEQLPVLKKAGVVDAGGAGLVCIFEGMQSVFAGNGVIQPAGQEGGEGAIHVDVNAAGEYEGDITFTYCTEFIVIKNKETSKDPLTLRAYLESIGDSAVVVDDEDIIKCHVHTDNPGKAIQKALEYGMLTKMKIDNMRLQYEEQQKATAAKALNKVPVDPDIPFGFVAVAAGEGVQQLFTDLGVNHVVSGGQTMNPSTDDIINAIEATPSGTVFVLPNNKNIIMAAEQAAKLVKTREVKVIPTRTIPQGLSAMLAFNGEEDAQANVIAMGKAAERVGTGQITFAARDSDYDGHKIKEGELLALENGKVSFTERDLKRCAVKLVKALLNKDSTFVTLIYGENVTEEQAAELEAAVREKLPKEVDLALINGGQPVYYLTISVE
ncbi:DAK2 domain-containing protein [Angelakisella massiliensis]|uniref:DAK2 domain-containing protein n=1 Tax=Angelakisella massiliensis TaxID=1871018 RepID=UPI0023A85128|nr:DAK2 domain-containing protein [Angelakisella massiliensis]